MARPKKLINVKSPVKLRRKILADGRESYYLDIYRKGAKRERESLGLYLIPGNSSEIKAINEAIGREAESKRAAKALELQNNEVGISNSTYNSKMLLADWMDTCIKRKRKIGSTSSYKMLELVKKHLIDYKGELITMKEVDKAYCRGFNDFLQHAISKQGKSGGKTTRVRKKKTPDENTDANTKQPRILSKRTAATYFTTFVTALNYAVKEEVIPLNPVTKISSDERIKVPESTVPYLTIDEVRALIDTPCKNDWVKRGYLFSCCCGGLRLIDVEALTWDDIEQDGTIYRVRLVAEKTERAEYPIMPQEAMRWLPDRNGAKDTDKVFCLPSRVYIGTVLKQWFKSAGIKKHATYHTSRHSFGTIMRSLGVDLDVIQKAMGHKNIKTTQIYAKVVDKAQEEAANLFNGLFDVAPVEVEG
jgi:integrase